MSTSSCLPLVRSNDNHNNTSFKQWFSLRGCAMASTVLFLLTVYHPGFALFDFLPKDESILFTTPNNKKPNEQDHRLLPSSTFEFKATSDLAPICDPIAAEEIDFTLVTQLSPNRLHLMEYHCKRWGNHAISVAVGTHVSQKTIVKALQGMGCRMEHVAVTVVSDFESDASYPVNRLRNAALAAVQTSHVVYIDADFMPSLHLYDRLMEQRESLLDHKTALVIPAFELRPLCDSIECKDLHVSLIPDSKEELLDLYTAPADEPSITPFDFKGNPLGHGSTRYMDWISQKADELLPIECMTSPRYEPYLVLRYCRDLPPFQQEFAGYGQNKITWMQHVRRSSYRFFQLGEGFLIHFPHKPSVAKKEWTKEKEKDDESVYVKQVATRFYAWMEDNVPNQTVVPQCEQ